MQAFFIGSGWTLELRCDKPAAGAYLVWKGRGICFENGSGRCWGKGVYFKRKGSIGGRRGCLRRGLFFAPGQPCRAPSPASTTVMLSLYRGMNSPADPRHYRAIRPSTASPIHAKPGVSPDCLCNTGIAKTIRS